MWRYCALTTSLFLLSACATNSGDTPGMPWLLWATARSLVGAPPMPPDFHAEPVRVSDALEFTTITAGGDHTCALTIDGDTYCWGANRYEQIGNAAVSESCGNGPGAFSCSSTPVRVEDVPRFTGLAASRWGTCGLDASGTAHCWGYGLGGRTESGLPASSKVPVEVPAEQVFTALASSAASDGRVCGLTVDGRVWCWGLSDGANGGGQSEVFAGPDPVPTSLRFVSISFGGRHGCGIDDAHNAYCWGNNELGPLGTGSSGHAGGIRESLAPVPVQGGIELDQVVAGSAYSCGLDTGGSAHCWGLGFPTDDNSPAYPRLSAGPLPHGALPVRIEMRGSEWVALGASDTQTCGLTVDGEVYCLSATPAQGADRRPIRIESDRTFVKLAVGNGHACAIGADAFAYCWGDGSAGQVGRPPSGRQW